MQEEKEMKRRGKLIAFESLDSTVRSSQIDMLQAWLGRRGFPFVRTREPGGTGLGMEVRPLYVYQIILTDTNLHSEVQSQTNLTVAVGLPP